MRDAWNGVFGAAKDAVLTVFPMLRVAEEFYLDTLVVRGPPSRPDGELLDQYPDMAYLAIFPPD